MSPMYADTRGCFTFPLIALYCPSPGTHVEHGKRRLFIGRKTEGAVIWHTKRRGATGESASVGVGGLLEKKSRRRRSGRAREGTVLLFLIDYSEGQRGDGLACTTPVV